MKLIKDKDITNINFNVEDLNIHQQCFLSIIEKYSQCPDKATPIDNSLCDIAREKTLHNIFELVEKNDVEIHAETFIENLSIRSSSHSLYNLYGSLISIPFSFLIKFFLIPASLVLVVTGSYYFMKWLLGNMERSFSVCTCIYQALSAGANITISHPWYVWVLEFFKKKL